MCWTHRSGAGVGYDNYKGMFEATIMFQNLDGSAIAKNTLDQLDSSHSPALLFHCMPFWVSSIDVMSHGSFLWLGVCLSSFFCFDAISRGIQRISLWLCQKKRKEFGWFARWTQANNKLNEHTKQMEICFHCEVKSSETGPTDHLSTSNY